MVMNCRIYIFKQVIFPHCNIQNLDLHTGPAGSSMRGLAGYPGLLVYLALPWGGGSGEGDGRAAFLCYAPTSIQPFLVWSFASVYTHNPHI